MNLSTGQTKTDLPILDAKPLLYLIPIVLFYSMLR
ncbi:hypothetical protein AsAng_0017970 [Aureispira anguillae]|uniref:Uncharacterized protein n=1 Tax=Aureispira anguillae TaxID=2864201 RepID=A0A915YDL8_9BACT|nr:hypothetical protein AsAng_0017970 [Aureispira anguillae]